MMKNDGDYGPGSSGEFVDMGDSGYASVVGGLKVNEQEQELVLLRPLNLFHVQVRLGSRPKLPEGVELWVTKDCYIKQYKKLRVR